MSVLNNAKELAPGILLIENAISNSQEIINKALSERIETASNAIIIDSKENSKKENLSIRSTQKIDISPSHENDIFWWSIAQKIWIFADEFGKKYDFSFSAMETLQLLWYKKNKGFYNSHVDSSFAVPRIASAVLYLNDVENGGETHFEYFNLSIKPVAGSLLLFPSDWSYRHEAKTPISNDKFSIVTWFKP